MLIVMQIYQTEYDLCWRSMNNSDLEIVVFICVARVIRKIQLLHLHHHHCVEVFYCLVHVYILVEKWKRNWYPVHNEILWIMNENFVVVAKKKLEK